MKKKLSVSIEEKVLDKLDEFISKGTYRNKSHMVEFALSKLLEVKEND